MKSLVEQIRITSENGDPQYGDELIATIDRDNRRETITFYCGGIEVFSMGANELPTFCEELSKLVTES